MSGIQDILDYPVQQALLRNFKGIARIEMTADVIKVTFAFDNTRDGLIEATIPLVREQRRQK